MNVHTDVAWSLVLPLAVLSSFGACHGGGGSRGPDKSDSSTTEATIDSSKWLRSSKGIRGLFEDSRGALWFTSTDYVCRFDGKDFRYFTEADGLMGIGQVDEDADGHIWISTGTNACRFDGERFTAHTLTPDTTGNRWAAAPDDIWFPKGIPPSSRSEGPPGVYRLHEGAIDFLPFPLPASDNADNIHPQTTRAIKGRDRTIWFGTMEIVVGFKDGAFTLIGREEMGRANDPVPVGIRGLYADPKGRLWIADNGSGVYVCDGDTVINFTKTHHLGKGDREGNTLHRSFCVAEDNNGAMWFGTVYSGIWRFDGTSFTNYTEQDGARSTSYWTIFKNRKGELLFCGELPGAVYKFNGRSFDRIF